MSEDSAELSPEILHGNEVPRYDPAKQIKLGEYDNYVDVVGAEWTRAVRDMSHITGSAMMNVGGLGLPWAVHNTPREVGRRFQAHGIAKSPIWNLDRLLQDGIRPNQTFYTMSFVESGGAFEAFGADMPKTEGGIILVSKLDESFPSEGDPNISYIALGEEYMRVVDILQNIVKDRNITVVPWHDVPNTLIGKVNEADDSNISLVDESLSEIAYRKKMTGPSSHRRDTVPLPQPNHEQEDEDWI